MTSVFTHVEVVHIGFNMLALWVLGPQLELVSAGSGSWGSTCSPGCPARRASTGLADAGRPTLGASGAIFGLMGALVVVALKVGGQRPAAPGVDRHQLRDQVSAGQRVLAGPPGRLPRRRPGRHDPGLCAAGRRRPSRSSPASARSARLLAVRSCSIAARPGPVGADGLPKPAESARWAAGRTPQWFGLDRGRPAVFRRLLHRAGFHTCALTCGDTSSECLHRSLSPTCKDRRPVPRNEPAVRGGSSAPTGRSSVGPSAPTRSTPSGWRR